MSRTRSAAIAIACAVAVAAGRTPAAAATYTVLYAFKGGSDGANPAASLIRAKGKLFGTTVMGGGQTECTDGPVGCGAVFSLNPTTNAEEIVHAFSLGDGAFPHASLINVGGTLYGTSFQGGGGLCGSEACGTLFSVNPKTGAENVVHSFNIGDDGISPDAGVIKIGETLYGTTEFGITEPTAGHGTVFSMNLATGAEAVLYSFQGGSDGANPEAGVIDVNGTLFGTTYGGGTPGYGTVFAVDPTTDTEAAVHTFQGGSDGANPQAALIDVDGMLYGTTTSGGGGGLGTIFSINPATSVEKVVYSFLGGLDGANPQASLISVHGTLYGTTYYGGGSTNCSQGCGTIFSLNPKTGAETIVHAFSGGENGANPSASLIEIKGTLYGTTYNGGDASCFGGTACGTVFAITDIAKDVK